MMDEIQKAPGADGVDVVAVEPRVLIQNASVADLVQADDVEPPRVLEQPHMPGQHVRPRVVEGVREGHIALHQVRKSLGQV